MPNPAVQRQILPSFPTPNVADIIVTETVDAERIGTDVPEYGTPHPDTKRWPNHRLCHIESADDQNKFYLFHYVSDQLEQDDDNWEHTKADIGGVKFDAVRRTYIVRRTEYSSSSPAIGSTMPDVPTSKFVAADYVLAEREQRTLNDPPQRNKILDGLYVIERRTYIKKVPLIQLDVDTELGGFLKTVQTLYYTGETITVGGVPVTVDALFANVGGAYDSFWGPQADGTGREGTQLTANWFLITDKGLVPDELLTGRQYSTNIDFYWPAVLGSIGFKTWTKNAGGFQTFPSFEFSKEAYRGPCKAVVTQSWAAEPVTVPEVDQMLPESIYYACPFYTLNIPPCLHAAVYAECDIGSGDDIYAVNSGSRQDYAATNYTDWPAFVTASDEQRPFRGGYLRTKVVVYKPASE